jgi:hypothetical protein
MKTAIFTLFTLASVGIAGATTISINFAGGGNGNAIDNARVTELAPGDIVGAPGYTAGNWNNVKSDWSGNAGALPASIVTSTGSATGISVSYDTGDTWRADLNEGDSTDHKLFKRYYDDSNDAGQPYVNVNGIPNAGLGYSVILYLSSDAADSGADVQLGDIWLQDQQADAGATILSNGGNKISPFLLGDSFTGTYVDASDGITPGNYIVFSGLTATNFTFRDEKTGGRRIGLAGMQIITVPEPSSAIMLGLSGLVLILRRKRK